MYLDSEKSKELYSRAMKELGADKERNITTMYQDIAVHAAVVTLQEYEKMRESDQKS